MFLFRLNPALITFVQIGNYQTLDAMIAAAKQVETGFSLSTGKVTAAKKKPETKELDALTSQIQQLSLNYTTLANAFVAQLNKEIGLTKDLIIKVNKEEHLVIVLILLAINVVKEDTSPGTVGVIIIIIITEIITLMMVEPTTTMGLEQEDNLKQGLYYLPILLGP